jgi:hypothetical protein
MPDAGLARIHEEQARDILRTCQVCGGQALCVIVRTLTKGDYTLVEQAKAVCPACAEKRT